MSENRLGRQIFHGEAKNLQVDPVNDRCAGRFLDGFSVPEKTNSALFARDWCK
jgi:hypothetical protein